MMYSIRFAAFPLIPISALLLGGCLGKTPPSQFYLLEPLPASEANRGQTAGERLVIAFAPVRIPRYVDRPQIVRATGRNAYHLDELHRWAESLDANMARVLTQDLSALVPADVVPANMSNRAKQADFRLSVDVLEFHVDPQGQAQMTAKWQITRGDGTVLSRQASYHAPASTTDYRTMVEGLNQCVNRLGRDIAASLRQETITKASVAPRPS